MMMTSFIPSDPAALGRRLRGARDRAGISISFAAKIAGITRNDLAQLERGRGAAALETLTALARVYRCPVDHLISGSGPSTYADAYPAAEAINR